MIAEHAVDAGVDQRGDLPFVLGVPTKGKAIEPMEDRDEAAAPIGEAEVDRFDAEISQLVGPTLRPFLDLRQTGRIDQTSGGVFTPLSKLFVARMAQPETFLCCSAGISCCVENCRERRWVFDIEGDLVPGSDMVVELRQCRDVFGKRCSCCLGDGLLSGPAADLAVVIEHGNAI